MGPCIAKDAVRAPTRTRRFDLAGLARRIRRASAIRRSRAALAALSPDQLRDIGLTPAQAGQEAARPFWDMAGGQPPGR